MGSGRVQQRLLIPVALILLLLGVDAALSSWLPPLRGLQIVQVASGFEFPVVGLTVPGSDRVWIGERGGVVREMREGAPVADPILDISDLVVSEGWEQGLLGMALHPAYPHDPRLFVSYTEAGDGDQVIASYSLGPEGKVDEATRSELLRVPQLSPTHQGGTIRFGPDGMLWIGLGDGGHDPAADAIPSQDPARHGQDPWALQGKLVRIDVDSTPPYAIPPDNPFAVNGSGAPEVWAYGLRNPWSVWFDSSRVFIGDVGFNSWEEIDVLDLKSQAGANLGWSVLEGPACFRGDICDPTGMTPPAVAVPRSPGFCAMIVGPPYRGGAIPELAGHLVYGDLCGSWVRTVSLDELVAGATGNTWLEAFAAEPMLTAFFEGPDGEWNLLTIDGHVYRLDPVRY